MLYRPTNIRRHGTMRTADGYIAHIFSATWRQAPHGWPQELALPYWASIVRPGRYPVALRGHSESEVWDAVADYAE